MNENELFSGIPSLDDEAGLEAYLNNSALNDMGVGNQDPTPVALQQQQPAPATEPAPAATAAPAQPATNVPQFSAEQVAEILARSQAQQAQQTRPVQQPVQQPTARPSGTYNAQQAVIIKQLIDKGVSLDRISAALRGDLKQATQQDAMAQRLQAIEQHLQQQQYVANQNAFIDKMTTFGNKFGLSEDELVTFGNKAQSMGINLIDVNNVEAVFRAVYPEQYAIRSQRLAGATNSQIFGGASAMESSRASASKLEDAYVDQFLKRSMPNQYGMNSR
jgi:hypothetical protein